MTTFRWSILAVAVLGCSESSNGGSLPAGSGGSGGSSTTSGAGGGGSATPSTSMPASGRRLTRDEIFNTLGEILGVDITPLKGIIKEDSGADGGFRNWRSALLPSGARTDGYEQAAIYVAKTMTTDTIAKFASCQNTAAPCTSGFVSSLGRLLYRRPLTDAEVARLVTLFDVAVGQGDGFERGARLVVQAMLQSPYFLYRLERADRNDPVTQLARVDSYELASRWSFLLWQSAPDAALLDRAQQGTLDATLVASMLESPKARRAARGFFDEWLGTYKLETKALDPVAYPAYSPELTKEMRDESLSFFEKLVVDERGSFLSAFTRQSSTIGPSLAALYGGGAVAGMQDWTNDSTRGGFLTQAGLIMAHTKVEETSIVDRGLFVLRSLMCGDVPPAPPGAAAQLANVDISLPQRVRFEQHREDRACQGCHSVFDPLGNPFEAYSALGQFKTQDKHGNPIQVSGSLTLDGVSRDYQNLEEFSALLAQSPQTESCVVQQLASYAFGRAIDSSDQPFVGELTARFQERSHDFLGLFQDLAVSPGYQFVPQEPVAAAAAQEAP